MYTYQIGYNTCEESNYLEVQHEKNFTEDELIEIVAECMKRVMVENKVARRYAKSCLSDDLFGEIGFAFQLQELFDEISNYLKDQGFESVKYDGVVDFFGWSSPLGNGNAWKTYKNETTEKLLTLLRPEAEKIIEELKKNLKKSQ